MCGRVTLTIDQEELIEILSEVYGIEDIKDMPVSPSYNMAPSSGLLSVIEARGQRRAGVLTWGFVAPWTKEDNISHGLINARSESIESKPTFKDSFAKRRCIIFANHFYEWKRETTKRPFLFQVRDQPLMPLAGIYSIYTKADGSKLSTCALVTCGPNELMAPIHHRMPVILRPESMGAWLSPSSSQSSLKELMVPYSAQDMKTYEVSSYVNSARNQGHACIEPLGNAL